MRLVHSAPDVVEFRGRRPIRAPIWVGAALLLGPFSLAVFGPAAPSPTHGFAMAALGAVGALLVAVGFPRGRWVRLRVADRLASSSDQGSAALPTTPVARLVSVRARGSPEETLYGVALDRADRDPLVILAAPTPDAVLSDLASVRRILPLHVVAGWGLPPDAPFVDEGSLEGRKRNAPWDDRAARRPFVLTLVIALAAIAGMMALEVRGRLVLGDELRAFSVVLPLFVLSLLVLATLVVATYRFDLHASSALVSERRFLGFTLSRSTLPSDQISRAWLVSPSGRRARHLLVETATGLRAFPCDDTLGARVVSSLGLAPPENEPPLTAAGR
ncbi:MAG TPA: hypothetical protein VHE30_02050 [Polyangiaceae bacterium]|nr:hypothetical protein [Polyangiaceae bacterium]